MTICWKPRNLCNDSALWGATQKVCSACKIQLCYSMRKQIILFIFFFFVVVPPENIVVLDCPYCVYRYSFFTTILSHFRGV
jgi:hypothetical protein